LTGIHIPLAGAGDSDAPPLAGKRILLSTEDELIDQLLFLWLLRQQRIS
jgi:hypothetical protein